MIDSIRFDDDDDDDDDDDLRLKILGSLYFQYLQLLDLYNAILRNIQIFLWFFNLQEGTALYSTVCTSYEISYFVIEIEPI